DRYHLPPLVVYALLLVGDRSKGLSSTPQADSAAVYVMTNEDATLSALSARRANVVRGSAGRSQHPCLLNTCRNPERDCLVAACGTGVAAASGSRPQAAPADNAGLARDIANIAVGKGGLAALDNGVARATLAVCDPGTVSKPPGPGTPASASCGINYSDGSVW